MCFVWKSICSRLDANEGFLDEGTKADKGKQNVQAFRELSISSSQRLESIENSIYPHLFALLNAII